MRCSAVPSVGVEGTGAVLHSTAQQPSKRDPRILGRRRTDRGDFLAMVLGHLWPDPSGVEAAVGGCGVEIAMKRFVADRLGRGAVIAVAIMLTAPFGTVVAGAPEPSMLLPMPTPSPLQLLVPLPTPPPVEISLPLPTPPPLPTSLVLSVPTAELELQVTQLASVVALASQAPGPLSSGPVTGGEASTPRSTPDAGHQADDPRGGGLKEPRSPARPGADPSRQASVEKPSGDTMPAGSIARVGSGAAQMIDGAASLPSVQLVALGVAATAVMAFGLAQLLGIGLGLGTLGGAFSAIAAALDRRASRRVRAILKAVPNLGRWGSPPMAPDAEDPILAAMNLPPIAKALDAYRARMP